MYIQSSCNSVYENELYGNWQHNRGRQYSFRLKMFMKFAKTYIWSVANFLQMLYLQKFFTERQWWESNNPFFGSCFLGDRLHAICWICIELYGIKIILLLGFYWCLIWWHESSQNIQNNQRHWFNQKIFENSILIYGNKLLRADVKHLVGMHILTFHIAVFIFYLVSLHAI